MAPRDLRSVEWRLEWKQHWAAQSDSRPECLKTKEAHDCRQPKDLEAARDEKDE